MNELNIEIQNESEHTNIPSAQELTAWAKASLAVQKADITIRIVDEQESAVLNETYRKKPGPTNVLSFPFSMDDDNTLYGDIIICAPVVEQEAKSQLKSFHDHFAHLIIHGILHLQGYDHIQEEDTKKMEQQEIATLSTFGIANPYE
jgi:probable rRNA maturation factor